MRRGFLPAMAMITVQVSFAGVNIISKLALSSGMSSFVMITYRQMLGTVLLAPFAYFWERKTRPKITWAILFQIFLCSLFGATVNQTLYFLGLKYSTPTIACALNNLLPAVAFIIAVPFRLETIGMKSKAGQAKVFGTILCVGGAMFMTFYKGALVNIWESTIHWRYAENMRNNNSKDDENTIIGPMLIVASCFAWGLWFALQAKMSKTFKSPYTTSALMCFMASIKCAIIGACVDRNISAWALGWDIRLAAVLYAGIVASGIAFSLMAWCIERRGPLYVSMFSPLLLIIVAIIGWGCSMKNYTSEGSVIIVGGLYSVLWGKGKELEKVSNINGKIIGEEHEEEGDIDLLPMHSNGRT